MRKSLRQMHRDDMVQRITRVYAEALNTIPEFAVAPPSMLEHAAYHAAHHTLSVLCYPPPEEPDVVDVVAAQIVAESEK